KSVVAHSTSSMGADSTTARTERMYFYVSGTHPFGCSKQVCYILKSTDMATIFSKLKPAVSLDDGFGLVFVGSCQREYENQLWERARERKTILEGGISPMVGDILGPEYRVEKIELRRGSVAILVFIAGAYTAVSHYRHFVESLELLVSQIKKLLNELFADIP